MTHPNLITVADYFAELTNHGGIDVGPVGDDLLPGICEQCRTAITCSTAYPARFGTLRCADCIGQDGFVTIDDLVLFARTGTLPCTRCHHPVQAPPKASDGITRTYQCPACGTTDRYTLTIMALALWGPGITGNHW
jgi:hypothetical protein